MRPLNEFALLLLWLLVAVLLLASIRGIAQGHSPFYGAFQWVKVKFAVAPTPAGSGGADVNASIPASATNGTVNGISSSPYGLIVNGVKM
jgi:hypothetical protein